MAFVVQCVLQLCIDNLCDFVRVCMCLCTHMQVCMLVCMSVGVCGGQKSVLGVFLDPYLMC